MIVRRVDIIVFESNKVFGNKFGRFNFFLLVVLFDFSFRGKRVYESFDSVISVMFFNKINSRVNKKKKDDIDEILLVGGSIIIVRKGDGDKGGIFYNLGERVLYERKELEEDVKGMLVYCIVGES